MELGMLDGVPARPAGAGRRRALAGGRAGAAGRSRGTGRSAHYDQALTILPLDADQETRFRLRVGAARARLERRELTEAGAELRAVHDEARVARRLRHGSPRADPARRPRAEGRQSRRARDATYARGARRSGASSATPQGVADALRGRGMTSMFRGRARTRPRPRSPRRSTSFRDLGDRRGEAWALQNLAWIAFTGGRPTEAEERINQSAATFAEIGDWGGLSWALGLLAWVRYNQGQLEEAEQLATGVLEDSATPGTSGPTP